MIYTEWAFFGLLAVAVFLVRRRGHTPPYRIPGHPLVPAVFLAFSWAIVVNQLATSFVDSAIGLGFVLVGLPVYYLWVKFSARETA